MGNKATQKERCAKEREKVKQRRAYYAGKRTRDEEAVETKRRWRKMRGRKPHSGWRQIIRHDTAERWAAEGRPVTSWHQILR